MTLEGARPEVPISALSDCLECAAVTANAGPDAESPLLAVDMRHLGGAAGVPAPVVEP